ncbi:MAG: phage tail protein, partial [Desulfobacterales bacterium]|nr:phage tail protein [Desulfobacterales bacterium]
MTDFYTLWTDQGLTKFGDATLAVPFNLTTAVVGDGNGNNVIPNKGQAELVNQVWDGPIASKVRSKTDPNTIVFEFVIPVTDGPFDINEVGLKDDTGELCIVGNWPLTHKPVAANGATRDMVMRVPVHFENADVVSLVVDPNVVTATKAELNAHALLQLDPTSSNEEKTKHLSDAQGKFLFDHADADAPHVGHETPAGAQEKINTAIAALVDSSPGTLDTLNELAAALGDDPNFATTVMDLIATKLNTAEYTAADVMAKLKTVDGPGCGLDADLLDSYHVSSLLISDYLHSDNGYVKLPTGLIIQWGYDAALPGGSQVVFPIAFPGSIFSFTCGDNGSDCYSHGAGNLTNAGFLFFTSHTSIEYA